MVAVSDLSQYVTVDSSGDYTLDTDAVTQQASSAAIGALASIQPTGGNWGDVNAALGTTVATMTAVVTLFAGAAAAGPLAPAAAALFGGAEALAALDPAHGGNGGGYDCQGNFHEFPGGSADWPTWASKNLCPECVGYVPGWYTIPGSGSLCHQTEDAGNGPRPAWSSDSFEAFAEKILLTDYAKNFSFLQFLQGKAYNFARWPALLSLAARAWNASHTNHPRLVSKSYSILGVTVPAVTIPGVRTISVEATTSTFANQALPGSYPSAHDPVSTALWLSQFSTSDWQHGTTDEGKIPVGNSIHLSVNNGPRIAASASTSTSKPKAKPMASLVFHQVPTAEVPALAQALAQADSASTSLSPAQAAAVQAAMGATPNKPAPTTTPAKTYFGLTVPELGLGGFALGGLAWLARKFF